MGSAAVEVLGIHAFLVEQGFAKEPPILNGDSSSALQLTNRSSARSLKHVEVSTVGNKVMGRYWTIALDESTKC